MPRGRQRVDLCIGARFGRLIVLERTEDKIRKNGRHMGQYLCICDCGNKVAVPTVSLKNGRTKSCGCLCIGGKNGPKDLSGHRFGKLTALYRAEDRHTSNRRRKLTWLCRCECGREVVVPTVDLSSGNTQSCGKCKYENKYEFHENYVIGYINKNEPFIFDNEDYDRIKDHFWRKNNHEKYIETFVGTKRIYLHRLIMKAGDKDIIDHINHRREDNRKVNLRVVTAMQNAINRKRRSNNTSGCVGVTYHKGRGRKHWYASITVNKECLYLGRFLTFEEAVSTRKAAEEKYFGEYSYDNSMAVASPLEPPLIDVTVVIDTLSIKDENSAVQSEVCS